jgi:hypothetical protein
MTATDAPAQSLPEMLHFAVRYLWTNMWRSIGWQQHRELGPVLTLVRLWLARKQKRFARLVALAEAGRLVDLPPPPPRAPRAAPTATPEPQTEPAASAAQAAKARLPSRYNWFGQITPAIEALPAFRAFVLNMLNDPRLPELLALAPRRFGRVLRPLCRFGAFTPDTLAVRRLLRMPRRGDPPDPTAPPRPRRRRRPRPPEVVAEEDMIWTPQGMVTPRQFRRSLGVRADGPAAGRPRGGRAPGGGPTGGGPPPGGRVWR